MDNIKINKRNYNMDLLRILSSFMVIILHVAAYCWYDTPVNTFNWKVYNFYDSIVRCAVPIFIMISGIFFLSEKKQIDIKKLYLTYILKLLIIYLFWSIIYTLYGVFIGHTIPFNLREIVISIINGPFHFWYIPTIIGLYIISPIIKKLTNNFDKKTFKYFFFIFFTGCLIKTICNFSFLPHIIQINSIISKLPIDIICEFYSYFILGYFLYNYNISKNTEKKFYILGIISIFLCMVLTFLISKYDNMNNPCFYNEFSIFTFFEAIALFLFFKNRNLSLESTTNKIIYEVSKCTLGIYILHVLIMNMLFDFNILSITRINTILSVPIISIIIFITCLIIVFIARKIKFIKKYLF